MNVCFIIGTVASALRVDGAGTKKCVSFSLTETTRGYRSTPLIEVYGTTADWAEKYLCCGKRVAISGIIKAIKYQKEGIKLYRWAIVATSIEFCERPSISDAYVAACKAAVAENSKELFRSDKPPDDGIRENVVQSTPEEFEKYVKAEEWEAQENLRRKQEQELAQRVDNNEVKKEPLPFEE